MSRKLLVLLLLGLLAIHHVSAVDIGSRLRSKLGLSEESGDDEGSEESGSEDSGSESGNDEGSQEGSESEESSDGEESSEGGGKAISATRLQAQQESSEDGESSCEKKNPCQQQPQMNEENNKPQKVDPEELVRPIDDWIKGFKKRTGGSGGNDLYDNAKATVKPLIDKLRRNQEVAQEKLKEANENILAHVQDATTEHVYKLLKASKKADDKAEKKEEKKEVAAEKSEEQNQKKEDSEMAKKVASEASSSAKAAQEISENADAIKKVAEKAAQKAS